MMPEVQGVPLIEGAQNKKSAKQVIFVYI